MGIPVPPIDFFKSMVDTLAKRYGWFYQDIAERMYWEDVYEMFEYSSNMDMIDKNEEMRFQFMLHATSKNALDNWRDLPIPYPDRKWTPPKQDKSKLSSVFEKFAKREKATPAQKKRAEEVRRRIKETQQRAKELKRQHYGY